MQPISGTPTETIDAEMHAVLQECLRVGIDYLGKYDTFLPFALLFRPDDKLERIEVGTTDGSTDVDTQAAYEALVESIRGRAPELHAVGLVTDVQLSRDETVEHEAIRVELEHRDAGGRALAAWMTYERGDGGAPTFSDELGSTDMPRRFWV
jgi:hypothetical protein